MESRSHWLERNVSTRSVLLARDGRRQSRNNATSAAWKRRRVLASFEEKWLAAAPMADSTRAMHRSIFERELLPFGEAAFLPKSRLTISEHFSARSFPLPRRSTVATSSSRFTASCSDFVRVATLIEALISAFVSEDRYITKSTIVEAFFCYRRHAAHPPKRSPYPSLRRSRWSVVAGNAAKARGRKKCSLRLSSNQFCLRLRCPRQCLL